MCIRDRLYAFCPQTGTLGYAETVLLVDDNQSCLLYTSSTTNQATVYIRICKQFLCIGRLAATTVKDRAVFSNFLAILLGNGRTCLLYTSLTSREYTSGTETTTGDYHQQGCGRNEEVSDEDQRKN